MNESRIEHTAWRLKLFVAGNEPCSQTAHRNLADIRKSIDLPISVEVIDVFQDFAAAAEHNVLVTPTLVADLDGQATVFIGDLSNRDEVCSALLNGAAAP